MFPRKYISVGTLLIAMAGTSFAMPPQDDSAKQDVKDAGHSSKDAAKDAGRATKKGAKKSRRQNVRHQEIADSFIKKMS
jgi:hypothetical protein